MIRPEDIKLLESERMTDRADGGGYASNREIIDGAVNRRSALRSGSTTRFISYWHRFPI